MIDESGDGINISSVKQLPINNHTEGNRGLIREHLPLEVFLRFCKFFENLTKGTGFELKMKTSTRKKTLSLLY